MKALGIAYLVGAGPGDPRLITVRGLELLRRADVVVYDRLADPRLLAEAPSNAELIDAGKGPGHKMLRQEQINDLLIGKAREGKTVVRLKGGDPFLFGRGGEEALALATAGVTFEVVPGVTSAFAAPAYAGIPVTHRGVAASVAVVTGSEDPAKEAAAVDWSRLAHAADTLVVLMGLANLRAIASALVQAGRPAGTPVALVRWGTQPSQQVLMGTLATIADQAEAAALTSPVVTIIGDVVNLRETLAWFDRKPLFGKRVLVTRTRQQAGVLSELLTAEGAMPLELPTIELVPAEDLAPLDTALVRLSSYQWVVFTSANAAGLLFQRLAAQGKDARAFGAARVCAIGPGTAATLQQYGILVDFMPGEYVAEKLLEGLASRVKAGDRVLLPRAAGGREVLPHGLHLLGAHVEEIPIYEARTPSLARERARRLFCDGLDIVTFTSSSTVRNLLDLLDGDTGLLNGVLVASIGPVTSATAREAGLRVDVEAAMHTVPGLARALVEHMTAVLPGGRL
ncbi:MAG: uroporphyrinogen-III C-methyltransferase [Dehalococcoidia bacterium]|nr:uroporphyrinogen-III C-methyltransferase [Dehalococcoidia bacterium]